MFVARQAVRRILLVGAITGSATFSGCAQADPTSPAARPAPRAISHDDATCTTGWVVMDGRLVCQGT
jgi:hypothetical protein